jgi:hypothetical protein
MMPRGTAPRPLKSSATNDHVRHHNDHVRHHVVANRQEPFL